MSSGDLSADAVASINAAKEHRRDGNSKAAVADAAARVRSKSEAAEKFLSDSNKCVECKESPASVYCHHCALDLCLGCSRALHDDDPENLVGALHKRMAIDKKAKFVEKVQEADSAEAKAVKAIDVQMDRLRKRMLPRFSQSADPTAEHTADALRRWSVMPSAGGGGSSSGQAIQLSSSASSLPPKRDSPDDFTPVDYLLLSENTKPSVFLSYNFMEDGDKAFAYKLVDGLVANGHTLWSDWLHVPSSNFDEWRKRLYQGIEESDAFVYVITPASSTFKVCMMEIDHALRCGKRVIPVLLADVDYSSVRKEIAELQWVFFQDHSTSNKKFWDAMKLMAKALDENEHHARIHTRLLTRSIVWKRSEWDVSLLLRGEDRKRARSWLYECVQGQHPLPTPLMINFISQCLDIPSAAHLDSYRAEKAEEDKKLQCSVKLLVDPEAENDVAFARKVYEHLAANRVVNVDWVAEEPSKEWLENAQSVVERSDVIVFIMTEKSLASEPINWSLDHAFACNKRVLPVVIEEDIDLGALRSELASLKWLFAREGKEEVGAVLATLEADIDLHSTHVHFHTDFLNRTIHWMRQKRSKNCLFGDSDLDRHQDFLMMCAMGRTPLPTPEMLDYYQAAEKRIEEKCMIL